MSNDANEYPKMLLNVDLNTKIVIESDLCANVRFFTVMNVSSRCWSPFHANECVFSRNEQQKVYYAKYAFQRNSAKVIVVFLKGNCL